MVTPEVRWVDVDDEPDLHAWWTTGRAAGSDRPYDAWPPWDVARRALPRPREDQRQVLLAARLDGVEAGAGLVVVPLLDDTHGAWVEVQVPPDLRRRGVGTTLLSAAEQVAADEGRRTLWAEVFTPVDATSDGAAFAAGRGYVVAEENGAKLLDLVAAAPRWPALVEDVAGRLGGHRVVTHLDRVADEHAEGLCALLSVFAAMLPDSDLDQRDGAWDVARLRAAEERTADRGSRRLTAVALDRDGAVVGFSDLRVDSPSAPLAAVGGTLVLPAHRGHGLGLALKLGTHTELGSLVSRGEAACTHVETQNATDNLAVNRVNERLGYREVERALDLQKVVAAI